MDVPLSRQPSCRVCEHEDHVFTRCGAWVGDDAVCPCPPHRPLGIYDPPGGTHAC